ncbi:Leucine Rich repeat [Carpediemonas membranifera]|uniref:Leucine Rich repeat n=1 Tax=Carpediemonas membranifera TaxID=201153 RepID=A0A8J6AZG4_9EUKA|nr:Leucine Rich repeat [Carpediemonas membranifera]|eukprot:KAG9391009.1 Leucine Rich repeat [Carpediemonas membranifera]
MLKLSTITRILPNDAADSCLTFTTLDEWAEYIESNDVPSHVAFNFSGNYLRPIEIDNFINSLDRCPGYVALDLSSTGLSDASCPLLSSALISHQVYSLNITGNPVTDDGMTYLIDAFPSAPLVHLSARSTHITDRAGRLLITAAAEMRSLLTLYLSGNCLGPATVEAMQSHLGLTSLLALDLHCTGVGSRPQDLIKAVGSVGSLAYLNLWGCGLLPTEELGNLLAPASRCFASLSHANFGNNPLGDEGVALIARGLRNNAALTHLDLSGVGITDRGAAALVGAVATNAALIHLNVAHNPLGQAGVAAIRGLLESHPSLDVVNVGEPVEPEAEAEPARSVARPDPARPSLDLMPRPTLPSPSPRPESSPLSIDTTRSWADDSVRIQPSSGRTPVPSTPQSAPVPTESHESASDVELTPAPLPVGETRARTDESLLLSGQGGVEGAFDIAEEEEDLLTLPTMGGASQLLEPGM